MNAPRLTSRQWTLVALILGAAGLVLRLWCYRQPVISDDIAYFRFVSEGVDTVVANALRIAFLGIPKLVVTIFGPTLLAFYLIVTINAAIGFAGTYVFSRVLAGPRVAALVALLWASSAVTIVIDTGVTPDNAGVGWALLGLAALAWAGKADGARSRLADLMALAGGFAIWMAFSVRASFFVFGFAALGVALIYPRRLRTVPLLIAGGVLGELVELVFFAVEWGDPLFRLKLLVGYGSRTAEVGQTEGTIYSGYDWARLVTRYPRLLHKLHPVELAVFFVGLLGLARWLLAWRDRDARAKALTFIVAYGFIAFGIVSVSPVVPIMREKVRYFGTASPLFLLAAADLLFALASRSWLRSLWAPRAVAAGLLAASFAFFLARSQIQSRANVRNGDDAYLKVAQVIAADAERTGQTKRLLTDVRTRGLFRVLLPPSDGWDHSTDLDGLSELSRHPGYALINWRRLNTNLRYGYASRHDVDAAVADALNHSVLARYARGRGIIDVFAVGEPLARRVQENVERFPGDWRVHQTGTKEEGPVSASRAPSDRTVFYYDGGGALAASPERKRPIPEGSLVEARVTLRSPEGSNTFRVYLYWWPSCSAKPVKTFLGESYADDGDNPMTFWTYLPSGSSGHRLVVQASAGVELTHASTRVLQRHDSDRLLALRDPFPDAPKKRGVLTELAAAAERDARQHSRSLVVRAEAVLGTKLEACFAGTAGAETGTGSGPGYIVDGSGTLVDLVRQHVVMRRGSDGKFVDLLYEHGEGFVRPRQPASSSFPGAWGVYHKVRKDELAVSDAPFTFDSTDALEQYFHSGHGEPWTPPADSVIGPNQLVQVALTGSSSSPTSVALVLRIWVTGEKDYRDLRLGTLEYGPETATRRAWVHLPEGAAAHRLYLRAKAPTTVERVEVTAFETVPSDQL